MTDQKQSFRQKRTYKTATFAFDLKPLTAIIFTLLIFSQPFSKIWIVVSFKITQKSIAKTLCVKKEIKGNTCQGKCHLQKQLDKATEEKQQPANTKEKVEVLYCCHQSLFDFLKQAAFFENKTFSGYNADLYISSFISDIFRPPNLILI